jgi:endonuclease/exonuclease/phosphatase family metal-dependent hydrolase
VRFGEGTDGLVVVVAHLSLGAAARMGQLGFIAELLAPYPHAVLMGDLNTEPHSPEMRLLFEKTSLQPPRTLTPTFPSWKPRRMLDHILTSADIELARTWTLPRAFSDHLPLAAEIRLPVALAAAARAATTR